MAVHYFGKNSTFSDVVVQNLKLFRVECKVSCCFCCMVPKFSLQLYCLITQDPLSSKKGLDHANILFSISAQFCIRLVYNLCKCSFVCKQRFLVNKDLNFGFAITSTHIIHKHNALWQQVTRVFAKFLIGCPQPLLLQS